ncbi:glycosyltransferase [Dyadobacter arcticus]|uniref:Glycosyltransferase involved in cell wall biosynthesis n=1 Tax=Dyadobacter arcticus TaxID=1078754 RepID=A0ABX0UV42_9BACT|nr:glycosyltransferase [Dyadobacter arcticus]NIJ55655.1 glycosyltransferase involved in cell wall biosynthesis [Dyadobacter arcticus]
MTLTINIDEQKLTKVKQLAESKGDTVEHIIEKYLENIISDSDQSTNSTSKGERDLSIEQDTISATEMIRRLQQKAGSIPSRTLTRKVILEMHILLIHQYFLKDHDGGGSRWNEMSRIWVREGHKVSVLAGTANYMAVASEKRVDFIATKRNVDGVTVIRCRVSDQYNSSFAGRLAGYFSFVFSSVLGGIFYARNTYDLIVVTSPPLSVGITALLLSFWKKIPFVLEIRDLWPESAIDTGALKNPLLIRLSFAFEKYLYRKARLINVLTPAFKDILVGKKGVDQDKIVYVPNAADFDLSEKASLQFDRAVFREKLCITDQFVIIYVGAHGVANHLIQLIEAAELLRDTNVCFLLIGDGMQKQELQQETERRGILNVRFMDPMPKSEIFRYILAADIGISVLKKAEAFKKVYSNKTFDYFSCKRPVIMAIDGISKQLVEEAKAGFFVEPENAIALAVLINFCRKDPELLVQLGENGYRYAKAHFDRNFLAKKYLNHLLLLVR